MGVLSVRKRGYYKREQFPVLNWRAQPRNPCLKLTVRIAVGRDPEACPTQAARVWLKAES